MARYSAPMTGAAAAAGGRGRRAGSGPGRRCSGGALRPVAAGEAVAVAARRHAAAPGPPAPGAAPGAPAPQRPRPRAAAVLLPAVQASIPRQDITNKAGEWNDLDVVIDTTLFRPWINTSPATAGGSVAISEEMGKFGPVALYVGGTGEVRFRDVSYKDVNLKRFAKEEVSSNFRKQQLTPFQYAWSQAAADIDRDGDQDIFIGPYVFLGPDYLTAREIYGAVTLNPVRRVSAGHDWLRRATSPATAGPTS